MPDLDQIKQGEQGARDRRGWFARARSGNPAGGVVGAGFEKLRWPMPVHPGDELRAESEVLEVKAVRVATPAWADQGAVDGEPER